MGVSIDPPSLAGKLLLAFPGIGDLRFDRAAITLCSHGPKGALGLALGQVIPALGLHALMGQLDIPVGQAPDAPVLLGGPMEPQRGFVLHSDDWRGGDTLDVPPGLGLTSTLDVLRAIGEGTGPARWQVALGYAGWGAGQLEEELARHGWFVVDGSIELMFDIAPAERWSRAFATAGVDVRLLASTSGRA